jgi:molybdopterin synthase catalytic subunit/molybdopterin synthase sulfur carrier subunit
MKITVQLFARAKDLAQTDRLSIDLPRGATILQLRASLARLCPALAPILNKSAISVDEEFAEDGMILTEKNAVAMIPPVSGGGGIDGTC